MTVSELYVATLKSGYSPDKLRLNACARGLGQDMETTRECNIFKDLYSGNFMREIGRLFYSPHYLKNRGGLWRIAKYQGCTPSDLAVIYEVTCAAISSGKKATSSWQERPFSEHEGTFWTIGVARPLEDYDGDELFSMVTLPADVEATELVSVIGARGFEPSDGAL